MEEIEIEIRRYCDDFGFVWFRLNGHLTGKYKEYNKPCGCDEPECGCSNVCRSFEIRENYTRHFGFLWLRSEPSVRYVWAEESNLRCVVQKKTDDPKSLICKKT